MTSWTARDLAKSLIISPAAAKQALTILEMQGYVKPTGSAEWITTPAGEIVSGSKLPRYTRETVGRSLESFADHLQRVNRTQGLRCVPYCADGNYGVSISLMAMTGRRPSALALPEAMCRYQPKSS